MPSYASRLVNKCLVVKVMGVYDRHWNKYSGKLKPKCLPVLVNISPLFLLTRRMCGN